MSSSNRPAGFSGLRIGGKRHIPTAQKKKGPLLTILAEVIREKVQDGLTGETKELQYTQCKIVGNGSFGVVFQTKLSPNGEDAAIKRVLQDKRFKVCLRSNLLASHIILICQQRIENFKS